MAEYKIVTWRQAFLDWRIDVYLGSERVYEADGHVTRRGAIWSTKRIMRKALAMPKENSLRRREEWFHV